MWVAALACRVSCPAYRIPADVAIKHEQLIFAMLAAIRPVASLLKAVRKAQQQLPRVGSGSNAYTVLHLKAEDAWIAQCATWVAKGALLVARLPCA